MKAITKNLQLYAVQYSSWVIYFISIFAQHLSFYKKRKKFILE